MESIVVVPVVAAFWKMGTKLQELRETVVKQQEAIKALEAQTAAAQNSAAQAQNNGTGTALRALAWTGAAATTLFTVRNIYTYVQLRSQTANPTTPPPNYAPQAVASNDEFACVVCFENRRDVVVQPCGHLALCWHCAEKVRNTGSACPICRCEIASVVFAYHA